tara:strand:+ start:343 stop:1728 length:1386 start_codon:yes stop_codon:yes gene_type:complete
MGLLDDETQQDYYNGDTFGGYQFTSLNDIINQFIIAYVGEDKLISRVKRTEVAFHAQRAVQELSFDTFKSCKSQEIELPPSLTMKLPQDYVNYTKVCWVDSSGVEHPLYPTKHTSNPPNILHNTDGEFMLQAVGTLASTNTVVLDAEYKDIVVGMKVMAPSIPVVTAATSLVEGVFVGSTSNASSITTIGLVDDDGVDVDVTYTGTETLTFENVDGSLILEQIEAVILEGLTWTGDDPATTTVTEASNKITAASTTDAAKVSVGMLVSSKDFEEGTVVIDVNGAVITVSTSTETPSTATTNEITFISTPKDSTTWNSYKSNTPSENNNDNYEDNPNWSFQNNRYGLETSHAQVNGSYYIDCDKGLIHFSSNVSGKTVILKYISDGLGTDKEMKVHKFAEEAMYKWLMYAVLSTRRGVQEYVIARYRKEKIAATRKAKLRLSNIKLEEITQILRGKSKWIKH